ncbi:FkbM family methyltransferase [Pyruvatibacter mobilis]|uniref:FkbM family methyltransferase n=1 Tax=Pyruvatibacter mobilis TaxID=1712261 RepID=UPI003BAB924B
MSKLPEPILDASVLNSPKVVRFVASWPSKWRWISRLNAWLPKHGLLRRVFDYYVFERPWARWHRFAYVPEIRDAFFDYILTFFYRYPVSEGDVIVQIGASNGEETSRFSKAVGLSGRVIAIEPVPDNVSQLLEKFPQDGSSNVTVVPKAAAKQKGAMKFLLGQPKEGRLAEIPGDNLTYEWWGVEDHLNHERYRGETLVQADTPQSILQDVGVTEIDFVLVETNGTELEVVEALVPLINRIKRIGARGHVRRDGVPIFQAMESCLKTNGMQTHVTNEEMVLAENPKAAGPV